MKKLFFAAIIALFSVTVYNSNSVSTANTTNTTIHLLEVSAAQADGESWWESALDWAGDMWDSWFENENEGRDDHNEAMRQSQNSYNQCVREMNAAGNQPVSPKEWVDAFGPK